MPTGIGWNTIPRAGASPSEQLAEQTNICWRATHTVEGLVNQSLRADVALEDEVGPNMRLTVSGAGATQMMTRRWPVTQVIGGQVAPASTFPPNWQVLQPNLFNLSRSIQTVNPATQSGVVAPDVAAAGPMFIHLAPGYVSWIQGRNGFRLQVAYINGWPHTSLTAPVAAGATSVQVDDVTGWAGSAGQIYDGADTETLLVETVAATNPISVVGQTVQAGPGTLTLTAPLLSSHPAGVLVTALPYQIVWAAALICSAQALVRGASAVTAPGMPGSMTGGGGTANSAEELMVEAEALLQPYKRIF